MNNEQHHQHGGGLHLDDSIRKDVKLRLLSVRGHIEGVLKMLDDESIYCVDLLKQVKAVQGALDKVGNLVLISHLKDHVTTAAARGDSEKIIAELNELLKYR